MYHHYRLLILLLHLLLIEGRGGRGGGGRGRGSSRGRGGFYGNYKNHAYKSPIDRARMVSPGWNSRFGVSSGGHVFVPWTARKVASSYFPIGPGSNVSALPIKTAIAAAVVTSTELVFGKLIVRDKNIPMKVDGIDYYWSSSHESFTNSSIICSIDITGNDEFFDKFTFQNRDKVTEMAWSCSELQYCCGWRCCGGGYEVATVGNVGMIGVILLSIAALQIPVVICITPITHSTIER